MSHFIERKEKNCLNCNAVIYGRYCHLCGQENVVPKETFGHLVTHFIYDVTHFDGKFFSSVKYLLFKPGFLSMEYIRGKRASYLNPIKMYVFISAFFFLFFFTLAKPNLTTNDDNGKPRSSAEVKSEIEKQIQILDEVMGQKGLPETAKQAIGSQLAGLRDDLHTLQKDTTNLFALNYFKNENINSGSSKYKDVNSYDSIQNSLTPAKRDNWFKHLVQKKKIELDIKYSNKKGELLEKLLEKFLHTFPQILFVSLPLFALILKLLYIRRKNFYYADHVIYTVHLYCATFIFMFFVMSLGKLDQFDHLHWLKYLLILILVYAVWYYYKSIRNFYKQGRAKTIIKFMLIYCMSVMLMIFLFTVFFVFSLFAL